MSIKVRVVKKRNPKNLEEAPKYYAVVRRMMLVQEDELARQISQMCTVKAPDVRGVLVALEQEIITNLQAGNSIHLDELGIIRNVMRSGGTDTAEQWTPDLIKDIRTQFIQRAEIRMDLTNPEVQIEKANYITAGKTEKGDRP